MTEIVTGLLPRQQEQVVFPPEHEAPRAWPPSLGVRPAKMLASLVAARGRPAQPVSGHPRKFMKRRLSEVRCTAIFNESVGGIR